MEAVIGIDLGTQGVRILAVDQNGQILASASEKLRPYSKVLPVGWSEQDPANWWQATAACLRRVMTNLTAHIQIVGIAIDSTSGTVLPIDSNGTPLHAALMYNDARSGTYAAQVRQAGAELEASLGYAFNASFALPKILWFMHEQPDIHAQAHLYVHAADYIAGKLTGDFGVTDYSNALKTGYDLIRTEWPGFIEQQLGLPKSKLPSVVAPGQSIGNVNDQCTAETGLPQRIPVLGGATDGTAAQIASGAVNPGAWNTSLGTTMVIKGITRQLLNDPLRRIYSHRHPDGWWMPGGASNTGCEWIMRERPGQNLKLLDAEAMAQIPTHLVRYPLARVGERFPFLHPEAMGFVVDARETPDCHVDIDPSIYDQPEYYAAGLEGTAMVERLAYDMLQQMGGPVGDQIHVTGGGSKSEIWLRIRASMLGRVLLRPAITEAAMGAAMLAATGSWYKHLGGAAGNMVHPDIQVDPDRNLMPAYEQKYSMFCAMLHQRGYL